MRLEGQSKLGYFPTPPHTLALVKTWLTHPAPGELARYFDPCCGEGEALAELANGHAESYGIELSDVRAGKAEDRLHTVLNTAYEYTVLTPETFSLTMLNPPYDGEKETGGGKRMEETFLCDLPTTEALAPGGVLIYLIPHKRLNERIARHLGGWYTDLRCFKLPGEEYDAFKQVVIFAHKRARYEPADGQTLRTLLCWQAGQQVTGWQTEETVDASGKTKRVQSPILAPLPELPAGNGDYRVPPSPMRGKNGRPFRFQYTAVSEDDMLREAELCARRLDGSRDWAELAPRLAPPAIEPAMTPKKGHIAMQVSGGLLGTNCVTELDGRALLLKGNVVKVQVRKHLDGSEEEVLLDGSRQDDDEPQLKKVQVEERFLTRLATLTADGALTMLDDPAQIARVLEKYVGQLAEVVQARNVPQYDMQPEPWEWAVFDPLSRGRRLPGRNETGLTDFQRHLSIALGRLCLRHGAGFVNAEMGSTQAPVRSNAGPCIRLITAKPARDSPNGNAVGSCASPLWR